MSEDKRREPRHAIPAEVQILRGEEIDVVRARNLSVSGVYVAATPDEHPELVPGARVEVVVSHHGTSIRAAARVIRREDGADRRGVGIVFEELDPENQALLRQLIVRASRGPEPH